MSTLNTIYILKETKIGKALRKYVIKTTLASKKNINKAIETYVPSNKTKLNKQKYRELYKNIKLSAKRYTINPTEYFLFDFENLNAEEQKKFVSLYERIFICEKLNKPSNRIYFDDKSETYKVFQKYYNRELLKLHKKVNNEDSFYAFIDKHQKFIVKPYTGAEGRGISIIDSKEYDNKQFLYTKLLTEHPHGCIIEELVIQNNEMGKIHPSSVNTIRISTIKYDDRVEIIHPFAKFGQGSSVVDNGGAGGILASIDIESGMITRARDELGRFYDIHPDTKEPIVGFEIPNWEDAKNLAKELANIIPSNRYTGWDLALTTNGWTMIEGNSHGAFIGWQLIEQKGFRDEITQILKDLQLNNI